MPGAGLICLESNPARFRMEVGDSASPITEDDVMTRGTRVGLTLLLAGLVCGISLWGRSSTVRAQRSPNATSGDLRIVQSESTGGGQHLVVVDTGEKVMGSYFVDGETGEIILKSVRNIRWDLMMEEFNGKQPSPREIRALLDNN